MILHSRPLVAGLACLLVASCGGGGGSSSSSNDNNNNNGGGGGLKVQFTTISQSVFEDDIIVQATVTMNGTSQQDVFVNFLTTGDAQEIGDFDLVTPSPLKIPLLTQSANLVIQVKADAKGELDEIVRLRIVSAQGAGLGANVEHLLTILDEDAELFPEVEGNDTILDANAVGTLQKTKRFDIVGEIQPVGFGDDFDVFQLLVGEDHTLDLQLEGVQVLADLSILVTDAANNTLLAVDNAGPGEDERGQYFATGGEELYVWVATADAGTNYLLAATALEFSAATWDGPNDETIAAQGFGGDRAGYMEWLRARHDADLTENEPDQR